ncbi:hypothetical protein KR009_001838, partial [Drosophila setifemur]
MEESETTNHEAGWTFKQVVPLVLLGYILGIAIALSLYWWNPRMRHLDVGTKWLVIVLGGLVVILLFYNRAMRCIMVLSIPALCSSRGRAFLISLAFVIAAMGPLVNIVANLKVLLRSLACSQEVLRQALGQMLDVIMEPVQAVRLAVDLMLKEVRGVLKSVMVILVRIQEYLIVISEFWFLVHPSREISLIQSLETPPVDTLKNCAAWLKSVVDLCNAEMGTPWGRCKKTAELAMERCRDKLGIFKAVCHATKLFLALCYPAKLIDVFCSGYWDLSWTVLDKVLERYHEFVRHIEEMFDANITFEHEFSFETNSSKSLKEVGEAIIGDINQRLSPFAFLTDIVDLLCWFMVFTVLLKSIVFFLRYTYSRPFQNVFITKLLEEVDAKSKEHGLQPLLPLHRLERQQFMRLTSIRLTLFEFLSVVENAFFLATTSLQLFAICFLDYGLFWLLATISYYGHQESGLEVPAYIDLKIKGGGFVGDTMRGIANAFRPLTQKSVLDTNPCLPLPKKPDYWNFYQIGVLCLLSWIMVLSEPYVLRIRHPIMAYFYPERAYERAVFLHWTIIRRRGKDFRF